MPGANLPELAQQIGLGELASISRQEAATDFMPAAIAGLADGDMVIMHPEYAGRMAELYGQNHYGDGLVAQAILRVALENGMDPGNIYNFQGFAADYFTQLGSPFDGQTHASAVQIHPEAVVIDGNPLALARSPQLVFDYGACLSGQSYIADQIRFLHGGQRPFTYSPLTRLHFTNQALINTYDAKYGQGTARAVIGGQLYIGREDGVAAATDEVIRAQRAHSAPTEVADIILATGAQHTTPEDMRRGIDNAYTLLREGGVLVVRSLARPASDELGTEQITGWAFDAGFPEGGAVRYEAGLDKIGTLMLTGHFGEREIQTVVLTK